MTGAAGGERSRLIRALALSRRFHLYLARCASPRAADQLVAALSKELPQLGRADVRLVRLEPYSARTEDTPLTDGELTDRVLLPLLDPPEELRGAIHLVDASRATNADTEPWARLFALWNEKRNVLGATRGEVVVMLSSALGPVFATAAPDVWSIRSGEYVIEGNGGASRVGLQLDARTWVSMPGFARSAVPTAMAPSSRGPWARAEDALLLLRAVSPLALFGGDLVVRPWIVDQLSAPARSSEEIIDPADIRERLSGLAAEEVGGLAGGPRHAEASGAPPSVIAQRQLRIAWWQLADRRFKAAEALFSSVVERADGDDPACMAEAHCGLAVALTAQDRATEAAGHGRRAIFMVNGEGSAARVSFDLVLRAARANALVYWCLGRLEYVQQLDTKLAEWTSARPDPCRPPMSPQTGSRLLRLAERGQVAAAQGEVSRMLSPRWNRGPSRRDLQEGDAVTRVVIADLAFLSGDLDIGFGGSATSAAESLPEEHASLARRSDTAQALVEITRGNEGRASRLLTVAGRTQGSSYGELEPEGALRAEAFHAITSGLLATVTGDPGDALRHFERARRAIAAWGDIGLDRRSRLRARVTAELLWTMLQPEGDPSLEAASDLARQAEALLGDTAEDHMSRALAVAAHGERARRLTAAGSGSARAAAQRAAALAQPLGGLGVPAWDELLRIAKRAL
ncbi:hypothetical protein [Sorangium sp. So ce513]|uniref:hypothetical protein n=1 Tax=Sorangium sp. So ce513 TaxID=3133315 RepID=UPI003F639E68